MASKRRKDPAFCRLPDEGGPADIVDRILGMKVFAVVGLSPKSERPSHYVSRYLMEHGYTIVPVNPGHSVIMGETCYPSVAEAPSPIDVVVIFRRSEEALEPILQAITKKAKAVLLQDGVQHEDGERKARQAGLLVVSNDCLMRRHARRG